MKKKKGLNAKLLKYLLGALIVVAAFLLIGSSVMGIRQYSHFYHNKALEIVKTVSEQTDGDFVERLYSETNSDGFKKVMDLYNETEDEQLYLDWLKEKNLYEDYMKENALIEATQENMGVKYLYVQVIHDGKATFLFDSADSYLSLGYEEELSEEFKDLKGNEALEPTISRTEFGWLSSSGEPILNSAGEKCAVVYVDIDMTEIVGKFVRYILTMIAVCLISVVVVGVLTSKKVRRDISNPIEQLTTAADEFGNAENGYNKDSIINLDIQTGDEIEKLYHTTRTMQENIIDYMENLTKVTAEKEQISAELNIATQIQANMLPRIFPPFPDRTEFEIFATMTPAKEVGGDFYDFFFVDESHLAMVMADVSGKGVPAALFMVIAKTMIKNQAQMGVLSPAEILTKVNGYLCEGNESEFFVTVWLAILDVTTGKGMAANAGHEHPAIRRAGGKYELIKYRHSPAVAVMDGIKFKEHEFELEPGDSLYVYTDGVAEATDSENELFGTDRMLDALNKEPDDDPKKILKTVKAEVDKFVGDAPQFDDITMLSLKYNGVQ